MDNGKEYINNNLLAWCREMGINLQVMVPYSLVQNGISKCFNQILRELVHVMRIMNDVPTFLWPEAIAHAAYIRKSMRIR